MKKKVYLILCFCLFSANLQAGNVSGGKREIRCSNGVKVVGYMRGSQLDIEQIFLDENVEYIGNFDTEKCLPADGKATIWNSLEQVRQEGTIEGGAFQGEITLTNIDDTITKGYVTNGKREGEWIYYNEEGGIYKKEYYRNDNIVSSSLNDPNKRIDEDETNITISQKDIQRTIDEIGALQIEENGITAVIKSPRISLYQGGAAFVAIAEINTLGVWTKADVSADAILSVEESGKVLKVTPKNIEISNIDRKIAKYLYQGFKDRILKTIYEKAIFKHPIPTINQSFNAQGKTLTFTAKNPEIKLLDGKVLILPNVEIKS